MTYHSHLAWEFEEEVTDEVVAEVITGLQLNKQYNGGKHYTPDVYATFSTIDTLILQMGRFIDTHDGQGPITQKDVDGFVEKAPKSGQVVVQWVLQEMELI